MTVIVEDAFPAETAAERIQARREQYIADFVAGVQDPEERSKAELNGAEAFDRYANSFVKSLLR